VIFVDAPLTAREERVKARGWDQGELGRRENAQMPLEEKRRRSDITVVNDATPGVLAERVAAAVQALRSQPTRSAR
jgi:dephospho-CoA kinase